MRLFCSVGLREQAQDLADRCTFDFIGEAESPKNLDGDYVLFLSDQGLSLCQTGKKAAGPISCDFAGGGARHRRLYGGGKSQTIAKAVGIKDKIRPHVADLTAGLGGDAFVLATLGCRVTLVERNPVVVALLRDGLERAAIAAEEDRELADILDRMTLVQTDSQRWLDELPAAEQPEVIYLDPMFPERKKSALVNKNMQAFQQVVDADEDADALLPLALTNALYRVVVKRPAQAPWLANIKPALALEGKSVRFDIYPLKSMR
jgi:16S rRNA (guanine1516-N2)-methyltransferase